MITQLIINGITLPQTSRDNYRCYSEKLSKQIDMINGRRVLEVRGNVQKISYTYDYLGDALTRDILSALRSNAVLSVSYLADDTTEMHSGEFLCESLTPPTFAFSRYGEAKWHNLAFVLREVAPND